MKDTFFVIVVFLLAAGAWLTLQKRLPEPVVVPDKPAATSAPLPTSPAEISEEKQKAMERHYKAMQKERLRSYNDAKYFENQ